MKPSKTFRSRRRVLPGNGLVVLYKNGNIRWACSDGDCGVILSTLRRYWQDVTSGDRISLAFYGNTDGKSVPKVTYLRNFKTGVFELKDTPL